MIVKFEAKEKEASVTPPHRKTSYLRGLLELVRTSGFELGAFLSPT
jgi:hypothetical protein